MFDLNQMKNYSKGTVLNSIFESREENIYTLTDYDKKKINELIKNNSSYEEVLELIDKLSKDKEENTEIKETLESYIDSINIIGAYESEKYYKIRILRCNIFDIRMCE